MRIERGIKAIFCTADRSYFVAILIFKLRRLSFEVTMLNITTKKHLMCDIFVSMCHYIKKKSVNKFYGGRKNSKPAMIKSAGEQRTVANILKRFSRLFTSL